MFWWSVLAMIVAVSSESFATPLQYSISFTGAAFSGSSTVNPLNGARIEAVLTFDPAALTPIADEPARDNGWVTAWPLTNTTAWINVSGTANDNGRYPAEVIQDVYWHFFRNDAGGTMGTSIYIPPIRVPFHDDVLNIHPLLFLFRGAYGTRGPLTPAPIAPSEVRGWWAPRVTFLDSGLYFDGLQTTGYAAYVPEPSSAAMLVAAITFIALRHRK
jgi:hypothetical protein